MSNILIICRKELKSYFASPIAYLLLAISAVVFGFFFYSATAIFVVRGMESQMMGRGIVHPVDDVRVTNPPANEPLLDALS